MDDVCKAQNFCLLKGHTAMVVWICLLVAGGLLVNWGCSPYSHLKAMEFSQLVYPFPVKTLSLDGMQVAYVDVGRGKPTLIFLHGLGSNLHAWQPTIDGLKDRYRCIALDLPGYGKSSKGDYPYTMSFFARVVTDFMDAMNIPKAVVVGHSMGGQIALTLALDKPVRVSRLVLIAPAGLERFTQGEKRWFKRVVTTESVKHTPVQQIRVNIARNFYHMPREAEFMVEDRIALRGASDFDWYCYAVMKSVHGMLDEPVFDQLPDIQQPTLIVFGENDNLIPNPFLHGGRSRTIARIGVERIPHAQMVMIPAAGHFVHFEKPEPVNQAIVAFLSQKR